MATLTITTTAPQDARIVAAFGSKLSLRNAQGEPRNATAAEVKAEVIAFVTTVVRDQEAAAAHAAALANAPIAPT